MKQQKLIQSKIYPEESLPSWFQMLEEYQIRRSKHGK